MSAPRLRRDDFVRAPLHAAARPDGWKEWYHFVVRAPGVVLVVNLSLAVDAGRPAPRVVVLALGGRATGVVARFRETDLHVDADLCGLRIGGCAATVAADGYRVVLDLPGHGVAGELRFVPGAPVVTVPNRPLGAGRMSWLFVPRLAAHGRVRIDGREHRLDGAPAYHDHNWGRFRWGDDFGWEWACAPGDGPWSMVFMRMTDRYRFRAPAQALYVWRDREHGVLFRDAEAVVTTGAPTGRAPDTTLPPVMALVLPGAAADLPAALEVTARRGADHVVARFTTGAYARIAHPSETAPDRSVVLCEAAGTVEARGRVGGAELAVAGTGVLEVCRG